MFIPKVFRDNREIFSLGVIVIACGIILFHFFGNAVRGYIDTSSLFHWWVSAWFDFGGETEHGPIILAIAIWLLIRNLRTSVGTDGAPRLNLGLSLIIAGLLLHVAGYFVQQTRISVFGFLFFANGSAYLLGGNHWGRAITFPCLLMLFSIHWATLTDEFGFLLRLAVIKTSYYIAQGCAIDVMRNGTQLFSPDGSYQYDVAPACSGIRSLIALSSLSLILGYLSFRSWWRRLLLLLLSIPFAFVGNVMRIFTIILAGEWLGQEAGSIVHEWFGFLIFLIVLGLAMLTVQILERFFPETLQTQRLEAEKSTKSAGAKLGQKLWHSLSTISIIVFLTCAVAWLTRRADRLVVNRQCGILLAENSVDPRRLPNLLAFDWVGQDVAVSRVEREVLPDDTGFSRKNYVNLLDPRKRVFLSIVLSGMDRSSIHRPEVCLVAQGWTIKSKYVHQFEVAEGADSKLAATVLRIERNAELDTGGRRILPGIYAYWFVSGDSVVPTNIGRLLRDFVDRLLRLKNHRWAYVVAQTLTLDGEEQGLKRLEDVIRFSGPHFQKVGF